MKRKLALILVCILVFSILAGCAPNTNSDDDDNGEQVEAVHLKFSTAVSENSTWHEGALKFAELIEERTEGRYIIDIYPSDQLTSGNQIKALEALQTGTCDFDIRSILLYTNFDAKFTSIMMPWLVPSFEAADEALAGPGGKALADLVDSKGMKFLAFGESGFRQVTNNVRPITTPEDFKGIKLRVPALQMYFSLFNQFGSNPTTMNMGEVFASIQQKVIDGQENPVDVIKSFKVNEVCKYMTLWNCSYDPIIMSASPQTWDKLSDEDKEIFAQAAKEAMDYQKQRSREAYEKIVEELGQTMEVTELTEEQIAVFREAAQPVYDEWVPKIGEDTMSLFGYKK